MDILFSIILPTFNRQKLIVEAINSVILQKYTNWELIIVDDGSTDNTFKVVSSFNDKRIRYYKQENKGKGPARNTGIKLAKGDFICFLDSDDTYASDHLKIFYNGINKYNNFKVFRTGSLMYDEQGDLSFQTKNMIQETKAYQHKFIWQHSFSMLHLCIENKLAKSIQVPNFYSWEDKHYALQIALHNPIKQLEGKTLIIGDHDQRSAELSLLNGKLVESQYQCREDILASEPRIKQLVGEKIIFRSMIISKFIHINNLMSHGHYSETLKYFISTIVKHPSIYVLLKSVVFVIKTMMNSVLTLFSGDKRTNG